MYVYRHGTEMRSLNALMPPQRAATLRLSTSADHQSNLYDVLRGDDDLPPSHDCPKTSYCGEYLTPAHATSHTWTTATTDGYVTAVDTSSSYDGLTDSGKYLQLQDSVYYEYI